MTENLPMCGRCAREEKCPDHPNCIYCGDTGIIRWSDMKFYMAEEGPVWIPDERNLACTGCPVGEEWEGLL